MTELFFQGDDEMENDNGNPQFDFGEAIYQLKAGRKVRRSGWNNTEAFLKLQTPDYNSKMTLPYIYIEYPIGSKAYPQGSRVPWLASQTDILSKDWVVVE